MPVPIADDKPIELKLPFQHVGEQRAVAVHFHAVNAAERGHHRLRARGDRAEIPLRVYIEELLLAAQGIPLVDAEVCPAIPKKMFCRGDHACVAEERRVWFGFALEAVHHTRRVCLDERR